MASDNISFHHPVIFTIGCVILTAGVLAHVPMFVHSSHMGYHMAGMPMGMTMWIGMVMIPIGLLMAAYGLMPRLSQLRHGNHATIHFHVADNAPLNREHWTLVTALFIAVVVDIMKPATTGFVMPGMTHEYDIDSSTAGLLPLSALIGTTVGSVMWGRLADILGRRASILLSALMFMGTAICGAMTSFTGNLVMCFLMGVSAGGLLPITFTLMAEMIPAAHRGWLLVALGGVGTCAGYLAASGAAALLEPLFNWRILWMLGLPTGLLVIFLNRFIPESPRFLANAGLNRQAQAVLEKFSGKITDDNSEKAPAQADSDEHQVSLRDLIHGPYALITYGLLGAGIAWGLVNFGFLMWLPTNLNKMGMSIEDANALLAKSGLLAVPGMAAVIWLYHHWSSIKTLVLFILATAAVLMLFFLVDVSGVRANGILIVSAAALLVSSSGVIAMLIPYAAEIYPVHMRGTGSGLVAAGSKFGGILGALFGVSGILDSVAISALLIACPLILFGTLLWRHGIDTRGQRLEDIHAAVVSKAQGSAALAE